VPTPNEPDINPDATEPQALQQPTQYPNAGWVNRERPDSAGIRRRRGTDATCRAKTYAGRQTGSRLNHQRGRVSQPSCLRARQTRTDTTPKVSTVSGTTKPSITTANVSSS